MNEDHEQTHEHSHPHADRPRRGKVYLEAGVIAAVAAFFAWSYLSRKVWLFLAPGYTRLVIAAAAALTAMAVARLRPHRTVCDCCDAHEHSLWHLPAWLCAMALLAPMVLALAVAPTEYSLAGRRKRDVLATPTDPDLRKAVGWVLAGQRAAGKAGRSRAAGLPENATVADVLAAGDSGVSLDGAFVTLTGQCDMLDGPAGRRFDLYRMIVTCCIADATTVAVEVVRPTSDPLPPRGWVRVQGVIRFDSPRDPFLPVLHAKVITQIPPPSEPYL